MSFENKQTQKSLIYQFLVKITYLPNKLKVNSGCGGHWQIYFNIGDLWPTSILQESKNWVLLSYRCASMITWPFHYSEVVGPHCWEHKSQAGVFPSCHRLKETSPARPVARSTVPPPQRFENARMPSALEESSWKKIESLIQSLYLTQRSGTGGGRKTTSSN